MGKEADADRGGWGGSGGAGAEKDVWDISEIVGNVRYLLPGMGCIWGGGGVVVVGWLVDVAVAVAVAVAAVVIVVVVVAVAVAVVVVVAVAVAVVVVVFIVVVSVKGLMWE